MKLAILATAATIAGTAASAELANVGGFSFGGEVTAEHAVDAEQTMVVVEPKVEYDFVGWGLEASAELAIYDNSFVVDDTFGELPTIKFRAEREVMDNLTIYGETTYDLEATERGEIVLGTTFAF